MMCPCEQPGPAPRHTVRRSACGRRRGPWYWPSDRGTRGIVALVCGSRSRLRESLLEQRSRVFLRKTRAFQEQALQWGCSLKLAEFRDRKLAPREGFELKQSG